MFKETWRADFDSDLYDYYRDRLTLGESELFRPINIQRLTALFDDFGTSVSGRRVLDVGCGEGTLVRAAQLAGWDALGIDLAPAAIAIAQRFGLPCHELDFFDSTFDEQRFDIIVMSEFIEHVPHPTRFLSRAAELLSGDGLLYVTTPNFASLGRRVLGADWRAIHPEHLAYFTPTTFRRAAAEAGLRVDHLSTMNLSLAAMRKLLGKGVRREGIHAARADEQHYRESVERSASLRAVKKSVNAILNVTRLGETMKVVLRTASTEHNTDGKRR